MKNKLILILSLIVIVVVFLNVITYIQGKNLFYNYVKERYFPDILNLEEQFGIKDYKTKPQKIVIDDYTITMDQYFYNNDKAGGCFRVKVENPNYDMRELEIDDEVSFYLRFRNSNRFMFFHDANGDDMIQGVSAATYQPEYKTIKTKDTLYIYYRFSSDDGMLFSGKVYLYDYFTQGTSGKDEYTGTAECACGFFDVSKN